MIIMKTLINLALESVHSSPSLLYFSDVLLCSIHSAKENSNSNFSSSSLVSLSKHSAEALKSPKRPQVKSSELFFSLCEHSVGFFFSPCSVWHQCALVWARSRARSVSLPSPVSFPDFLCMLRLTQLVCYQGLSTIVFFFFVLSFNPQGSRTNKAWQDKGRCHHVNFSQITQLLSSEPQHHHTFSAPGSFLCV